MPSMPDAGRSFRSTRGGLDRLLILGLDGATYDLLVPLAEQNVMPHLSALLRHAALIELDSTDPPITPTAWTTFQTGCDPWDHGIFDYRYLDHASRRLLLNTSRRIQCPTMFDAVSAAGGEIVSLNLPMTWPRRPSLSGVVVGGIDSPSSAAALAAEPRFADKLRAAGVPFPIELIWRRRPRSFAELSRGVERTGQVFRSRVAAAELADSFCPWRLMVVQFQTLDALQHRLWDVLANESTSTAPASWTPKARQAMTTLDECVGRLCELAARRNAGVMILSDHGFGPFRERIELSTLLQRRGLQTAARRWSRLEYRAARLAFKTRKSLVRRLRPGQSSAALPRPPGALLPIDWRRSRAVTLHSNLGALVYLNTPQRFGRGPISSPRLYDEAVEETMNVLGRASHPRDGTPLFDAVHRVDERIGGDPIERQAPDVLAIPAPGFHTRSKPNPGAALLSPDRELSGTHRRTGVLMIASTATRPGMRMKAALRDVAPTALRLLGIPIPMSMTGRVIDEVFASPLTHERQATLPVPSSEASVISRQEQLQVEVRLRRLGYLD